MKPMARFQVVMIAIIVSAFNHFQSASITPPPTPNRAYRSALTRGFPPFDYVEAAAGQMDLESRAAELHELAVRAIERRLNS